jgi:hypothetical protein
LALIEEQTKALKGHKRPRFHKPSPLGYPVKNAVVVIPPNSVMQIPQPKKSEGAMNSSMTRISAKELYIWIDTPADTVGRWRALPEQPFPAHNEGEAPHKVRVFFYKEEVSDWIAANKPNLLRRLLESGAISGYPIPPAESDYVYVRVKVLKSSLSKGGAQNEVKN